MSLPESMTLHLLVQIPEALKRHAYAKKTPVAIAAFLDYQKNFDSALLARLGPPIIDLPSGRVPAQADDHLVVSEGPLTFWGIHSYIYIYTRLPELKG